jgi:hypothetical protein
MLQYPSLIFFASLGDIPFGEARQLTGQLIAFNNGNTIIVYQVK